MRKTFIASLSGLALAALPAPSAAADTRPIEWVVGYAAGGGSDVVARTLAEAMGKTLNQVVIINNKPGAGTNIAADYAAKSKDYGHLMFTAGSPHHLATELLRERAGLKLVHVPYRGAAPAVQDLIGGQVPFMFIDTASGYQHIASGKLKAIGVASAQRLPTMSSVPTLIEQGLGGFEAYAWQGLVVPAGTPPEVVGTLSKALLSALDSTPVKARLQVLGVEPTPGTPAQMAAYAHAERDRWGQVIRSTGIKLD